MNLTIHNSKFINKVKIKGDYKESLLFLACSFITNKGIIVENININFHNQFFLDFVKKINGEINYLDESSLFFKVKDYIKFKSLDLSFINNEADFDFIYPLSSYFSDKIIYNGKTYENITFKDYYELNDENKAIGVVLYSLMVNKPLTLKISFKMPYLDIFKSFGFDMEQKENMFYIHPVSSFVWDNKKCRADKTLSDFYVTLASLNGEIASLDFVKDDLYNTITSNGLKPINNGEKTIISNQQLISKGTVKKYKGIISNIINPFLFTYSLFGNSLSVFEGYDHSFDELLKICDQFKISYKMNNGKLIVYPKKDYSVNETVSSVNNIETMLCILVFSFINKGTVTIKNAEILLENYPDLLKTMESGLKFGAIEAI